MEFNLLYRFHAPISENDEKWSNKFFDEKTYKYTGKTAEDATSNDFRAGLYAWIKELDIDPGKRSIDYLERDPYTGKFDDDQLMALIDRSINDPVGL